LQTAKPLFPQRLCVPAREQILNSYWGRLGRRWPGHVEQQNHAPLLFGAEYSIDGGWILRIKILNWRELRAKTLLHGVIDWIAGSLFLVKIKQTLSRWVQKGTFTIFLRQINKWLNYQLFS